jgi:hypothetical protein
VLYGGEPVGSLTVRGRCALKLWRRFTPSPGYASCRAAFEEAGRWAQQFDQSPRTEAVDYLAWDRWIEAVTRITPRISLSGVPDALAEFAIDHDLDLEITSAK